MEIKINQNTSNYIECDNCKYCGKTFTEYTNTIFSSTKKGYYVWLKYLDLMMKGASLYNISKELNISVVTAFHWRHKVLNVIKQYNAKNKVNGVVEAEEIFLLYSHKGQHIDGIQSRTRGGASYYRGLSKEKVGVLVAIDRNKNILARISGNTNIIVEDKPQINTNQNNTVITYDEDVEAKPIEMDIMESATNTIVTNNIINTNTVITNDFINTNDIINTNNIMTNNQTAAITAEETNTAIPQTNANQNDN